jgi:sugar/nucleoside kinase (ribokinase family)
MTAARLVHVGSAVVDYVYRIDYLPASGSERVATNYTRAVGGGFNMMVAAIRTGLPVMFAGQHGTGPDGDFLRAELAGEQIKRSTAPNPNLDSGNCVVLVTSDAERTFVSWPGAEGIATDEDMAAIALYPQDWVFASGYTLSYPGSRVALADWLEALPEGIPLVFDPTPVVDQIPGDILSRVLARTTWLSCNEAEAGVIAGDGTPEQVCKRLIEEHCAIAEGIVLRAGAAGSFVRLADGTFAEIPGFSVAAVDSNGAGDTHIGSFVSALARGVEPMEAARYANAAAAISVTRHGGASAPTHPEIESFLADRTDNDTQRATA